MGNRIKTKAALLVALVAFLMVATAFAGALASPAVHPGSAQAASSNASAGGKMNLLTDLGNGNTLLQGDVGINLPGAIPTQYTQSPPVEISSISVSPGTTVQVGVPVLMSVHASSGLPPYTYSWSFGNGQTGTGNAVTVSYMLAGTYTVIATAQDSAFHTASSTVNITVVNNLQIAVSPSSQHGLTGIPVQWSYMISGGALNYTLSINYGLRFTQKILVNATNGLQSGVVNNTYASPGTYVATFTVVDSLGDTASAMATVNVTYAPLNVSLMPDEKLVAGVNEAFTLSVTGGTGINQAFVNWGDASTPTTYLVLSYQPKTIYHTYVNPGLYTIQFNATDSAGAFAQGMITVSVARAPLGSALFIGNNTSAVSYSAPLSVALGHEIVLNATISGGLAPYSWVLFDNNTEMAYGAASSAVSAPGFTVFSYTIDRPGFNVFELIVIDSNGVINFSNEVTVNVIPQTLEITNVPSPTHGFAPLNVAFNVSLYNVEFNSSGEAVINISYNVGAGIVGSVQFAFSGPAGTYANEYNILAPYTTFTYLEYGNYSTQFKANYAGNSTIVDSNIVIIHVLAPPELSVSIAATPTIGQAPLNTSWTTDVSGGLADEYFVDISFGSQYALLEQSTVPAGVSIMVNHPGFAELAAPALFNANGEPYFDFTYNIVYGLQGTFTAVTTVYAYNNTFEFTGKFTYDVTIVVQRPSPLFLQLFASKQTVGVGQTVFFDMTINGGGAPYFILFTPNIYSPSIPTELSVPAPVTNAPVNFQTEPLNVSGMLMYNYFNYTSPGTYTALIAVVAPSTIGIPIDGYYVLDAYLVTINVIGFSVGIQQQPKSNLVAPVDIAFSAVTSGGQAPFTYQWALSTNGSAFVNVSTQQSFVLSLNAGHYTMELIAMDSLGNMAVAYHSFTVGQSTTIIQVVSARVQATLFTAGGPTYYAYSGPAMWGQDGSLNATFAMPNVPALNAQYTLNVSYAYTVAVTQFVPLGWYFGSWETYFYNVYSPQPYAQATLTVVAGGQILSASQLQGAVSTLSTQINGVNTNLSVQTSSLMSALQSGFKTVNAGIVTIQAQGTQIEASLSAINATVKSVSSGVSGLSGSLSTDTATLSTSIGTIQTSLNNLNATVTLVSSSIGAVKGAQVMLSTDVGTLSGDITNVSSGVATIQTTAGQIKVAVSQIQGSANTIKSGISTMELLDAVIIVLVLIAIAIALFSVARSNALAKKLNGKGKNGGSGGMPPAGGSTLFVAVRPVRKTYRKLK